MNDVVTKLPWVQSADRSTVNPEVVGLCEDLLRQALAGEIVALSAAFVRPNRNLTTTWTGCKYGWTPELAGAIARLQFRFHQEAMNETETG